ncbi:MAG TPA: 2-dehydropantoate 2-reductase [Dehalococcoidia bacterium]|nr:2-dehydropantoate 2-reductase [Dehalococcoidia bacterium]
MAENAPIVVAGAGSVGQAFAGLLADSGESVVLVASKRTAERLRKAGAIEIIGHVDKRVPVAPKPSAGTVGLVDDPSQLSEANGIIFTPKGQDLPGLARALAHVKAGWVLGLENGVVKNDVLASAFGEDKVVGAATLIIVARLDDGRIALANPSTTFIGEVDGSKSERVEQLGARLNAAGIPTRVEDNIRSVEWSKACNAVGAFSTTVLTRLPAMRMMASGDSARAFVSLAKEAREVARASGVEVGDYQGFSIGSYTKGSVDEGVQAMMEHRARMASSGFHMPDNIPPPRTSMQQDVEAGRAMEVEEIFADIVERGHRLGVPVPRLELARDLLRAINGAQQAAAQHG